MVDSLKSKTLHALFWSFFESVGLQGMRFFIGIVLARLLFPEEFGLIGMLMIFMAIAQTLLDSGFGAALIQRNEITQKDICSIFYFNILVGVAVSGLLCLVAPWIATFYNQPILTLLTRAMSLVIIINSFSLIQNTILLKQIDFKTQTKVSLISVIMSGIIGISLAAKGFGVWSLVFQQISSAFFRTVLLWLLNPWRPTLIFSFKSLKAMFSFGSKLLASGLLNQVFENIYLMAIGKLFSARDLGFFTRALNFQNLPSSTLANMVDRVTFPIFSTIQNDPNRLKRGLHKALTTLVLVNFPMMIGLAVIARPLVLILLTEKWSESIPYLQLLCFLGLLFPLHVINLNVLKALGRSDLFLRLEVVKKALILINIAVTWRWGISAMILGMIVFSIISYYLNSYYTGVLVGYPIREQLRDLFPYLTLAVLMGVSVTPLGFLPFPNDYFLLIFQIVIGTFVYLFLCRIFRIAAFMEIWQLGWGKILSGAANRE